MTGQLATLVAEELSVPADVRVQAMAQAIAGLYPGAARAILFYGSCLRQQELDGLMLDFYLIVSDYRAAYGKSWLAWANRAIPPNVFPFAHGGLAAKYAVLSEADLQRLCGPEADTVSVWARFAQPARLVWVADDRARASVIASVARAAPTLLELAAPQLGPADSRDPLTLWEKGFALTYSAELRAERKDRADSIVASDPARYTAMSAAVTQDARGAAISGAINANARAASDRRWAGLRRRGKLMTVVRLAKASFTFSGGIDYLAWKINRHAGTAIQIRPWQRRWPLLGALTLLPRLLKGGAIR